MLRAMFLGLSPFALGVSAAFHAAALLAPTAHGSPSLSVRDETFDVELSIGPETPPEAPEPQSTLAHVDPTKRPKQTPPDNDSAPHDAIPVHMLTRLTRSPVDAPAPTAPTAPAEVTSDDLPRFTIAVIAASDTHGTVSSLGIDPTHDEGAAPIPERSVDGQARLVRGMAPAYPDGARADGVEGDVGLELVVDISGAVESARVLRGVGHGLDESAMRAARRFRFAPATKWGHPVRVRMGWSVQFRLQ